MKKLKELIGLLNLNKLKSIEVIHPNLDSDTKLMELYHGIRENKIDNDEVAWNKLYPEGKNKNAYYKLKHTLRNRLYNSLFFIDVKSVKYSDLRTAKLNLQKQIRLINILLTRGLKLNAIDMARKGLKTATYYEFTEEQLHIVRTLRSHAAILHGNTDEFKKYDVIARQSAALLNAEVTIEGIVQEILALYVNDKSTKTFVYDHILVHLKALKKITPVYPSANWIYHHSILIIAAQLSINEYEKALATCENALDKINQYPFKHTTSIINISSQAIICCMQLQRYDRAVDLVKNGLAIMQIGIFNWFKYQELYMMICFHTAQYSNAAQLFFESTQHANYSNLPDNTKEIWKIFEAWIHFLAEAGLITKKFPKSTFKIARYINEVPTYSKDKSGLNVSILISQIALLLVQEKYDRFIDKAETIAKYRDRYLDREHNLRSKLFINMLLKIQTSDFKQTLIRKKTNKDAERLKKVPLPEANQSADIEILPYEKLWEILLSKMAS